MTSSSAAVNELSATNTNSEDASKVHLKIMSPSPGVPADLAYHIEPTTTINALKGMITESLESNPSGDQQKLIYRGKILEGASTIGDVLTGNHQEMYTLHLVISPPATATNTFSAPQPTPPIANPTTAAFRPEFARFAASVGTNPALRQTGGFTTTTVHTTTSIITPRGPRNPFNALNPGGPSGAGSSEAYSRGEATLERLQQELRTQRETLDRLRRAHRATVDMTTNTSTRFGSSSGVSSGVSLPGLGTNTTVRSGMTSPFGAAGGGTANTFPFSPLAGQTPTGMVPTIPPSSWPPTPEQTIAQNLEYIEALRRGQNATTGLPSFPRRDEAAARRRALQDSLREMEQEEPGLFPGDAGQQLPTATPEQPLPTVLTQPVTFTQQRLPENSLVYLLRDPSGRPHSLLVGPPGSAIQNPSVYPDLHYRRLHNVFNAYGLPHYPPIPPMPQMNPGVRLGPAPPPAPPNIAPAVPVGQQLEALRRELLAMNPNAQIRQYNIPRLVRVPAGHLWLALKLAVFVILFTGNGGWQRMLSLGFIAVLIFIWQTGLLNQITRPLIEAFYPTPPPGFQQQPVVPQQQQQQPLNPAHTAQMLVNRQEDRLREVIRNAERAFMIFMASLVPGWHDRHVNAIERQQQQAREAAQQQQQQQQQQQRAEEDQPQPAEARGAEVVEGVL